MALAALAAGPVLHGVAMPARRPISRRHHDSRHEMRREQDEQGKLGHVDQRIADEVIAVPVEGIAAGEQHQVARDVHHQEGEQQ